MIKTKKIRPEWERADSQQSDDEIGNPPEANSTAGMLRSLVGTVTPDACVFCTADAVMGESATVRGHFTMTVRHEPRCPMLRDGGDW